MHQFLALVGEDKVRGTTVDILFPEKYHHPELVEGFSVWVLMSLF